jgi:hypothetical protein
MIAQVFTTSVAPGLVMSDELVKKGEESDAQLRRAEGCEGIFTMFDSTGQGLHINLFRDQASLDGAEPLRKQLSEPFIQIEGVKIGEPKVYEVLIHL